MQARKWVQLVGDMQYVCNNGCRRCGLEILYPVALDVAGRAGIEENDERIAVPERNATLHINISEVVSREPAVRTNLPQINHVLKCHMGLFVAGPVAAI